MNSIHDMGGMHGFGPVDPRSDAHAFHEPWEGRVYGMQRAMGYTGLWNIDQTRAALEALPPQVYLEASYYQRWALGLERRLVAKGLVTETELATGHAETPGQKLPRVLTLDAADTMATRGNFERAGHTPPRFQVGQKVLTQRINPTTHTRLPRYARGRAGLVTAIRGRHVYPDAVTVGRGEDPQWLYCVEFASQELWGPAADPTIKVSIEAFEPYLLPA